MSPRRSPVPRARSPLHWLAGLLLLGLLLGGLVAAAITLWENVDIRELTGGSPPPPPPPPAARIPPPASVPAGAGFEAAVYDSRLTAGFFPDSSFYPGLVEGWEERVREAGGRATSVDDPAGLDSLPAGTLLVVPAGLCLSGAEVAAIDRHLAAGGSVLATWATGARDAHCAWRGWEGVARLAGSPDVRQLGERSALYLTLPGGSPFLDGLSPATRVELRSGSQLAVALSGPHAYWSDWSLNPAPAASGGEADGAAVARTTRAGGRVVWLGFLASEAATPRDSAALERVLAGGLRWAAGVPSAGLAPWPDGHDAALLVAEEAETSFTNADTLARLLRRRGTPGSFYVVSSLALDHPELAAALDSAGEVGTETTDNKSVAGKDATDQRLRLSRSRAEVRGWTGRAPVGLRPPEERFDSTTLRLWRKLGGEYILAVNDARVGSPELYDTPDGRVALLPRIVDSDYNVMVRYGRLRRADLVGAYLSGARKLGLLGGLAVLSIHTQVAGAPGTVDAVGTVLDSLAEGPVSWWTATGASIARWWRVRSAVSVEWLAAAGDTLRLRVTAPPGDSLGGAWLQVTLPATAASPVHGGGAWSVTGDGRPLPYRPYAYGLRFPLGSLEPGRSLDVRLAPAPPAASGGEATGPSGR